MRADGRRPAYAVEVAIVTIVDAVVILSVGVAIAISLRWTPDPEIIRATRPIAPLLLALALAAQWTERLCRLLYAWPIRRSRWRTRLTPHEHMFIRVPFYLLLYLGTSWSAVALALARSSSAPIALRVVTMAAVIACALPFWLVATQPIRYWRRARETHAPPGDPEWQRRRREHM